MNAVYVALVGLAGALIGSLSSIVVMLIQSRVTERRERIRQAMTLALEDLKLQVAHAPPGTAVFPISIYLYHQMQVLKATEENDLTPDRLRSIANSDDALIRVTKAIDDEFRSKVKQAASERDG
jgi:hypothetical protein